MKAGKLVLSPDLAVILEWAGAACVIVNLVLLARRSLWNYAFGILAAALYFLIFWQAKLYGGASLQILSIAIQAFGWRNWRAASERGQLPIGTTSASARLGWLAGFALLSFAGGLILQSATDARLPFFDAALTSGSIACQALLALRRVEGWFVWAAVNIGAIVLFGAQGLFPTAALYIVFLVLSLLGLRSWRVASRRASTAQAQSLAA